MSIKRISRACYADERAFADIAAYAEYQAVAMSTASASNQWRLSRTPDFHWISDTEYTELTGVVLPSFRKEWKHRKPPGEFSLSELLPLNKLLNAWPVVGGAL